MDVDSVIQQALDGMIALMLAKFVLNDVPHAASLSGPSVPLSILYSSETEVVAEGVREWGEATFQLAGRTVGRALFTFYKGGEGELDGMEIYPEYRGKGYGTKAYSILEEKARELGVKRITIFVQPGTLGSYEDAKRFWERVGFTVYPTQEAEKVL